MELADSLGLEGFLGGDLARGLRGDRSASGRADASSTSQPPLATDIDIAPLVGAATDAAGFLKALGHDGRLLILCQLVNGPKCVAELEVLLSARQAVVSQQLARLRHEGLVRARRDGQSIIYSIQDPKVIAAIALLAQLYRAETEAARG